MTSESVLDDWLLTLPPSIRADMEYSRVYLEELVGLVTTEAWLNEDHRDCGEIDE